MEAELGTRKELRTWGRLVLVCRLATRDVRRHVTQAVLLLLVITGATTVLTLGLALNGVTDHPYQQTRAATNGPDVIADFNDTGGVGTPPALYPGRRFQAMVRAKASQLVHASGVRAYSGPYPVASAIAEVTGLTAGAEVEGRSQAPAAVDQPKLTAGGWVRPGGVVIERTFAEVLGVGVGDRVSLNGKSLTVAGIAVTAAKPPYPNLCYSSAGGCYINMRASQRQTGLIWATERDAGRLATPGNPLTDYVLVGLRLAGRRPRRAALSAASIAVTVAGVVAVLAFHATVDRKVGGVSLGDLPNPVVSRDEQMLLVITVILGIMAALNTVFTAWATALDAKRASALMRALGASSGQVSVGLMTSQVLTALPGAIVGIPLGMAMFGAANTSGSQAPPVTWTAVAMAGILLAVAGLTTIPAMIAARTPATQILQSETA
jgi:putative ABC transport system permease protein